MNRPMILLGGFIAFLGVLLQLLSGMTPWIGPISGFLGFAGGVLFTEGYYD